MKYQIVKEYSKKHESSLADNVSQLNVVAHFKKEKL